MRFNSFSYYIFCMIFFFFILRGDLGQTFTNECEIKKCLDFRSIKVYMYGSTEYHKAASCRMSSMLRYPGVFLSAMRSSEYIYQ